jgi:hypothetical protein
LPLAYHESEIDEHLYICKTGVSFFSFCELSASHSFDRRRMIRFLLETKTLTRDEDGRLIFSFYFTRYDTEQRWN